MNEKWKKIFGYESYEVSNFGRIRSLVPHILTPMYSKGYQVINLYSSDGNCKQIKVQKLVLEAFRGPRPAPDYHSCHNDGNKINNHISNLRWDTPRGNAADSAVHGTLARGERHGQAKLTDNKVREIRDKYATQDLTMREIAAQYGVTPCVIRTVIRRLAWRHVP